MQGTEGESVSHNRFAQWLGIGDDVRGVKQLLMAQATEGALSSIRTQDALPERPLVQAHAHLYRGVAPSE